MFCVLHSANPQCCKYCRLSESSNCACVRKVWDPSVKMLQNNLSGSALVPIAADVPGGCYMHYAMSVCMVIDAEGQCRFTLS